MKKMFLICCFVVTSLLILKSVQVNAEEGRIRIGKLKVVPSIDVQGIHDYNIYLGNGSNNTDEIEESDWITHFKPALLLDYPFNGRGSLKMGYQGDWAFYSDNDNNDWDTQKGFFNLDYKAPGGLIVGFIDSYSDAEDPYGSLNEYGLGQPQTSRWSNDIRSKVGYEFSNRFRIFAYHNSFIQDYDKVEDFTQDYYEYEYGIGAQVRIMPKTWGFTRYHYGSRNYNSHPAGSGSNKSNDSDFDWHRVNAGLTWDIGAKLQGELNFGYQWREYDNPTDPFGDAYDEKDTWIAGTNLIYSATTTTTLGLNIIRRLNESGSNTNEYFEMTGFGVSLQQILYTKFTLGAGFNYSLNEYNLPVVNPREDDNYRFNLDLLYRIQTWLTASVGYSYHKKDSNYVINEFTDNQVYIALRAAY